MRLSSPAFLVAGYAAAQVHAVSQTQFSSLPNADQRPTPCSPAAQSSAWLESSPLLRKRSAQADQAVAVRMEARRAETAIHGKARFTTAGPAGHGKTVTSPDLKQP